MHSQQSPINPAWNLTIWRAVQLAGGPSAVARRFGMSAAGPRNWYATQHAVPSEYIRPLCEMGGNIITPEQILEECEKRTEASAQ